MKSTIIALTMVSGVLIGCDPHGTDAIGNRVPALPDSAWNESEWISAKDAPVFDGEVTEGTRAADGTSWFVRAAANEKAVKRVVWMTTGLGVYELYVNGRKIGNDFLKPGFTDVRKTRRSFTYDITEAMRCGKGEANVLAAEVSAGWWRDKIVTGRSQNGFFGRKSAFRGVIEVEYADGSVRRFGTNRREWRAGTCGPVTHAAIFDGEEYDARQTPAYMKIGRLDEPEINDEFKGEILPSEGAEICLRRDIALAPVRAYSWKGVTGADANAFGKVEIVKEFKPDEEMTLEPGETLVVDFGQNAAAVPAFRFQADEGTVLTALPAEMLNDMNGLKKRGNDGPEGSVYRVNLRAGYKNGRLVKYTFAKTEDPVDYVPRFTFFGYRYVSVTATGKVRIVGMRSIPVTSISQQMELGRLETGVKAVNQLISNVRWGQRSNYLSVPTDCPQRNERLGWTADTQVFCEAGSFNADTSAFFHKWMRDMRDSQHEKGGFPGVAPYAQYGNETCRIGWADAGVVVPYQIWKQFGDRKIIDENWSAMERFMARINETKYRTAELPECNDYQWADWLSLTRFESCPYKPEYSAFDNLPDGKRKPKPDTYKWWNFLGGAYLAMDADMMVTMAKATGKNAAKYEEMAKSARECLKKEYFNTPDGTVLPMFDGMQTAYLFALKLGLVAGDAKAKTIAMLKKSITDGGGTLHTGFLGTSIAMETLTENGMVDIAYSLLLNHKFPGWLYSVDQGATTIWERWNSYTKKDGFGPVSMNSFNHYAYGSVLAWMYKHVAGIAADPAHPGFKNIIMAPKPDRRLGHVEAEYLSAAGTVKSAWRYEGDEWIWDFAIPEGATATVTAPGDLTAKTYGAGEYRIIKEPH